MHRHYFRYEYKDNRSFIQFVNFFNTQESVPPVMAFHMGSLGFLTPFEFDDFQQQINNVLKGWNMNL